jgi:parallel beta-helix repeat protein
MALTVCLLSSTISALQALAASPSPEPVQHAEISVGIETGDIRGSDHRALQAAVDYIAELGGGTVHVGPGRYRMRNALKLRDNVNVIGVPGETILEACNGATSPLAMDGDANERQITVEDASNFRVGDGVAIDDRDANGFAVTTATLIAQIGTNSFKLSEPLYLDYMVSRQAATKLAFPVVGAWRAKNVVIEGLTIDGNRSAAQHLNGCRGGGIYLFECEHVTIRNCTVHDYRGDGISFQVSQYVTLEDCLSQNNDGLGLHPGSGSQHPIVRRCRSLGNTSDGLYVCWRVKHGLFEDNEIRGNLQAGISIGHKDTDNLFRGNTVMENTVCGVLFRNEAEAMGAHRNRFESNRILDNGNGVENGAMGAAIVIQGHHHDLAFQNNTIGNTHPNGKSTIGILTGKHTRNLDAQRNEFLNVTKPIE